MCELLVEGGERLCGELTIQGSKKQCAADFGGDAFVRGHLRDRKLPEAAGRGCVRCHFAALGLLHALGGQCARGRHSAHGPRGRARRTDARDALVGHLSRRDSGALQGKRRSVIPAAASWGRVPFDLHLSALSALGAEIRETGGELRCRGGTLLGSDVYLPMPSVGATENALLCACGADGVTTIYNAAREPEIVDLQNFINAMGGNVRGAGGSIITVEGKRALHGGKYRIIADRIVGATYLCAAACCGGEVRLRGVDPRPLSTVSGALSEAGCTVKSGEDDVFLQSDGSLRSIRPVRTAPYPGFPTDAQPVLMAALLKSAGSTVFVENIFENRYRHVDELARMGAEVRVAGRVAVVTGREHLHGARVKCTDLRAGAALVIAGLQADGLTRISRIEHIDRGYESIERDLGVLGAHVRRETGT